MARIVVDRRGDLVEGLSEGGGTTAWWNEQASGAGRDLDWGARKGPPC